VERHRRRCRTDRREVVVPFRGFQAVDVAGVLGCLLPVQPGRPRARGSSGIPVLGLAQRCDSLGNPLLGFGSSTRCCPPSPPPISRSEAPLLGFRPLQRSRRRESTSPPVARLAPRFDPGPCRRVPPRRLRCRSQVFATSQRLLPLSALPPFSGRWRSWGSPYRGLILMRSPGGSSLPAYPLDVFSREPRIPRS
jgi:hypothetical protein